jgi:mRNA-degrading endonuclease YafQ of YafQ-DinJ toxin-antitoxin module
MRIRLDEKLQKEIKEIGKKDPKLFQKIQKQLGLFAIDPRHGSLRVHKLSGELDNMWSISITMNIRMIYLQDGNEAYFFDLGSHDEVYKK